MEYAVVVMKLSAEDGGGYLARVPDLYGCMSDGSTPEEAVSSVQDAILDWIEIAQACGRVVPEPGSSAKRAKERESALIGTIKILSEQMDGIDGRLDELFKEIEHVRELMENQDAWSRLEGIFNFDRKSIRAAPLVC